MTAAKYEAQAALQVCTLLIEELLRQRVLARNDMLEALTRAGAEREVMPEVSEILYRLASNLRSRTEARSSGRIRGRTDRRTPRYLPLRRMRSMRPGGGS